MTAGKQKPLSMAVKVAVLVAAIFTSGLFVSTLSYLSTSQPVSSTSQPKAALVDQLSLKFPNQTFIQAATNALEQAGYTVDYYPNRRVTVDFYRNLPTSNYSMIIFRVDSAIVEGTTWVGLFTSERYDKTKYVYEQYTGQLGIVSNTDQEETRGTFYFSINPPFVTQTMNGRFQNTIIIIMGCNGLQSTTMANTFIQKGAKAYTGYSDLVLANYTDQATTHLLQHFLTQKHTLKESVQETLREVGPDPTHNSQLRYYPEEAGNLTIENTQNAASALITNSLQVHQRTFSFKRKTNDL